VAVVGIVAVLVVIVGGRERDAILIAAVYVISFADRRPPA